MSVPTPNEIQATILFLGNGFVAREIVRRCSQAGPEDALVKLLWSAIVSTPLTLCSSLLLAQLSSQGFKPEPSVASLLQLVIACVVGILAAWLRKRCSTDWWSENVGWRLEKAFLIRSTLFAKTREAMGSKPTYLLLKDGRLLQASIVATDAESRDPATAQMKLKHVYEWIPASKDWNLREGTILILRSEIVEVSENCPAM